MGKKEKRIHCRICGRKGPRRAENARRWGWLLADGRNAAACPDCWRGMIALLGELWAISRFPCQPPVALPEDLARISDGLYMTERGIVRIRGGVITATLGSESGDLMDLIGPHPKARPRPLTPEEAIRVAREACKD
jgi:hypothetical protein